MSKRTFRASTHNSASYPDFYDAGRRGFLRVVTGAVALGTVGSFATACFTSGDVPSMPAPADMQSGEAAPDASPDSSSDLGGDLGGTSDSTTPTGDSQRTQDAQR
jgi:hypothetical protein